MTVLAECVCQVRTEPDRKSTRTGRAHAVRPYVRLQACLVREVQVLPWYSHSGQKPTGTAFPRGEVESTWR